MSSPETEIEKPKGIRWWPAFFIVGLIGVAAWIGYLHFEMVEERTYQFFAINSAVMVSTVLLTLWWLLFSRARWWARLLVPMILAGTVYGTVRFEGFSGEMVPSFSWKWEPPRVVEAVTTEPIAADVMKITSHQVTETDWPGFRGADRSGVVKGIKFAESWLTPKELWRIPMGKGWSAFAAVGTLLWTQEQHGEEEMVVCYEAATGARVWSHADKVRFFHPMGGAGPRATPTFKDGRLYTVGGTGLLNCFDAATGKLHWSKDTLKEAEAKNIDWGMAGSPLIYGDTVIVSPGGTNGNNAVAYDLATGDRKWNSGPSVASYAAPQLVNLRGEDQILIHHGDGVTAYNPADGGVLWMKAWTTGPKINVAQPTAVGESAVMLSSGYGRGSILFDVTKDGDSWSAEERWRSMRLKSKFGAFLLRDSHVFGLDENYLACLDVSSGDRMWKGDKYGYGQLLLIDDVILIMAESGDVAFVKADPAEFKEIGRFKALEGKTWNHPVIANGRLYVRNGSEGACFDLVGVPSSQVASAD
jgi:outer membrane protein assembly factor BamB